MAQQEEGEFPRDDNFNEVLFENVALAFEGMQYNFLNELINFYLNRKEF